MNLDNILIKAYEKNASDVHLVVGEKPIFRIDGELDIQEDFNSLTKEYLIEVFKKAFSEIEIEKFNNEKELDTSYEIKNITRFRINLYWERDNPCFVARVIAKKIPTMDEIMMPEVAYDLINKKQGLILVTGPTGCGKSTTLASMINEINENRKCNIITLEDPIEFLYENKKSIISQRQIGFDTKSYKNALKHVLREDPDVIMVGEMRDLEAISATITLAETGHLVFATLHTVSSSQTIDRIVDVFPNYQQTQIRMQLSMVLLSTISQRLVPKVGGGRIAAREVLINTSGVSSSIRENKISQIKSIIQTSLSDGMFTMNQSLESLYKSGIISPENYEARLV
ncbi:PilT/PilU family type 4a pilus ATPase [Patescibacteria group bacterium]|nr:PilT/PilU family type 4a pilus ATPase [Patescibacteria group bacterium]